MPLPADHNLVSTLGNLPIHTELIAYFFDHDLKWKEFHFLFNGFQKEDDGSVTIETICIDTCSIWEMKIKKEGEMFYNNFHLFDKPGQQKAYFQTPDVYYLSLEER